MYTGTDDRCYQELLPEVPPSQSDLGLNLSFVLSGTKGTNGLFPHHPVLYKKNIHTIISVLMHSCTYLQ